MYLFAPILNDTIQNNTIEQLMHDAVVNEDNVELTAPAITLLVCLVYDRVYRYLDWQNDQHVITPKSCGEHS